MLVRVAVTVGVLPVKIIHTLDVNSDSTYRKVPVVRRLDFELWGCKVKISQNIVPKSVLRFHILWNFQTVCREAGPQLSLVETTRGPVNHSPHQGDLSRCSGDLLGEKTATVLPMVWEQ